MSLDKKIIAIDAMTVQKGVKVLTDAVFDSLQKYEDIYFILVGDKCDRYLAASLNNKRVSIQPSSKTISNNDSLRSIRRNKDSSTYITAQIVGEGKANAGISFGNTKAVGIAVADNLKPLSGLKKIPLAGKVPSFKNGEYSETIMLDGGATTLDDCTPKTLLEFGILGVYYAKNHGIEKPNVGLLSNGSEKQKGTKMLRETNDLYEKYTPHTKSFNYLGFVEGRDIFIGDSNKPDVVVTDGFTGNAIIKTIEGEALFFREALKKSFDLNPGTQISGKFAKIFGAFDELKELLDPDKYGGAFFLGLDYPFIKGHGASEKNAIKTTIEMAYNSLKNDYKDKITKELEDVNKLRHNWLIPYK